MKYSRYSRWQPFILFTSQIFLKYKELFILFFHSAVFVTSQESMTIIVQAVYERTDEWAKQSSLETQIFIKTVLKGQDWELKVQNHCSSAPCNNCPDSQASSRWAVLEEWRNALAELCCSPTAAGRTKLGNTWRFLKLASGSLIGALWIFLLFTEFGRCLHWKYLFC